MRVVVGRLGRAHGIRGDLSVEVRTDEPDLRFAPGARLFTDLPGVSEVEVERSTWHSGRLLLHLVGVDDRTAAESMRGALLEVDVSPDEVPSEDDEFYDRQLVGLRVERVNGTPVGEVLEVVHLPGQDLLVVGREGLADALVPFVAVIVPEVDLPGGRVLIDPPPGLLDEEGVES